MEVFFTFIAQHWISLIFGLLSTGILAYCRKLSKKFKDYQQLQEEKDWEEIAELIDDKLVPIFGHLDEIDDKFDYIKESYKYRLIFLCDRYITRGYTTPEEYHGLTEMWKVYHEGLHGNHQAEDYYRRAIALPTHPHPNPHQ